MLDKKDIFRRLGRVKSDDDFKATIRKCKCEDIQKIVQMLVLVLSKKVPVSPRHVRFIKNNRKCLRHLVHPQYSLKSKKIYLMKHGGTLSGLAKQGAKAGGKFLGGLANAPSSLTRQLSTVSAKIPLSTFKGMTKSTSSLATAGGKATTSLSKASSVSNLAKASSVSNLAKASSVSKLAKASSVSKLAKPPSLSNLPSAVRKKGRTML